MLGAAYFGQNYCGQGYAERSVVFDASSSSGYEASLSTYSWSHTCGLSARGLIVNVSIFATGTVSSITYNSVALTFVRADTNGVYRNEIWELEAPAYGTHTVAVTLSASLTSIASAASYGNVDQTNMVEGSAGANGLGGTPTLAITTTTAYAWLFSGISTANGSVTPASSQRARATSTGVLGSGAAADNGPFSTGSQNANWSAVGGTDSWALTAVALNPFEDVLSIANTDVGAATASASSPVVTAAPAASVANVPVVAGVVTLDVVRNGGLAQASATANTSTPTVAVSAGLASASATGYNTTFLYVPAGLASATATGRDTARVTYAFATNGTHQRPLEDEAGNPILDEGGNPVLSDTYVDAEAFGYQPGRTVAFGAGAAAPALSAPTATPTVLAQAGAGTATGSGLSPQLAAPTVAGVAAATATARQPQPFTIAPNAGAGSATATGRAPSATLGPNAGVGSATGSGSAAGATVAPTAQITLVSAIAEAPVITTAESVNVGAGLALVGATAPQLSQTILPAATASTATATGAAPTANPTPAPGIGAGSASAGLPAAAVAPTLLVPALATASGLDPVENPRPAAATASAIGYSTSAVVAPTIGVGIYALALLTELGVPITDEFGNPIYSGAPVNAVATAYVTGSTVVVAAGLATATGAAYSSAESDIAQPGVASVTAAGAAPSITAAINAGLAATTASAMGATVQTEAHTNVLAGLAGLAAAAGAPTATVLPSTGAGAPTASAGAPAPALAPVPDAGSALATAYLSSVAITGLSVLAGVARASATAPDPIPTIPSHVFTPPLDGQGIGPVNPDTPEQSHQWRLRGHFQSAAVGINVWKLPDGTYTQDQPYPLITRAQVRNGEVPINGLMTHTYELVYLGGHSYEIDAQEAAELVAAGYPVG